MLIFLKNVLLSIFFYNQITIILLTSTGLYFYLEFLYRYELNLELTVKKWIWKYVRAIQHGIVNPDR